MRTGILSDENVIKDCAEYQSLPLNTQIGTRSRPKHIKALTDSVQKIQIEKQGLSSINETGLALNQYRRTNQQNLVTMPSSSIVNTDSLRPLNLHSGLDASQVRKIQILDSLNPDQILAIVKALNINTTNAESQQLTTEDAANEVNNMLREIAMSDISPKHMREIAAAQLVYEADTSVASKVGISATPPRGRTSDTSKPKFIRDIRRRNVDWPSYFESLKKNESDSTKKPLMKVDSFLKHMQKVPFPPLDNVGDSSSSGDDHQTFFNQAEAFQQRTKAQEAEQRRTGEPNYDERTPAESTRSQAGSSSQHGAQYAVASTPQEQAFVKKQGTHTADEDDRH